MSKQAIAALLFSTVASLGLTVSAQAGTINQSVGPWDSPNSYDFNSSFPTPGLTTTIGTYTFSIPTGMIVDSIMISGTFGNGDSPTTALSDYYLGFAGDETAVEVANCDSPTADCADDSNGPTLWTLTLNQTQINELGTGLFTDGSLDFSYTWDSAPPAVAIPSPFGGYVPQNVYAGAATIDITYSPEPATFLFCFSGIAGIVTLRRFRKI